MGFNRLFCRNVFAYTILSFRCSGETALALKKRLREKAGYRVGVCGWMLLKRTPDVCGSFPATVFSLKTIFH